MSKKRLMRGKKRITGFLAIAIVIIAVFAMPLIHKARVNDFINNSEIVEISVSNGHGLDYYCYQVKPDFIEIDEYRHLIMEENNLPQSGDIYAGQIIKFYK